MALSIPVTWSDEHRLHTPQTAAWVGVRIDADELPERAELIRASLEEAVDPGAGWFPHFFGFADESRPANLNLPLPPGSGDAIWLAAVDRLAATAEEQRCEALVVALGVDAAAGDPNSRLAVTEHGYREAGRRLGTLGVPTVFLQGGGYVLETIGPLVRATLEGFEGAR